jgi:hypothetical protein
MLHHLTLQMRNMIHQMRSQPHSRPTPIRLLHDICSNYFFLYIVDNWTNVHLLHVKGMDENALAKCLLASRGSTQPWRKRMRGTVQNFYLSKSSLSTPPTVIPCIINALSVVPLL